MTVGNFVGLAEGKIKNDKKGEGVPYFDGLKFHRIIPNFMIQGGCPNGNGSGDPGYSFPDELDPNTPSAKKGYVRGTLAMANRGPNTNGSQFFIMQGNTPLPLNYTIFGSVVKGLDVVDSIINSPRDPGDKPLKDQVINHIIILRKGKEAEAFDAPKVFETEKANVGAKAAAKNKAETDAMMKILNEKYPNAQTTPSGIRYIMVQEGTGKQPNSPTSNVTVHYTGTFLSNDQMFDSDRGQSATFNLNQVISGWTEGVQLLKEGGKIKLILPPNLAYGEGGRPGIPPNSWLVFDIELMKVNN